MLTVKIGILPFATIHRVQVGCAAAWPNQHFTKFHAFSQTKLLKRKSKCHLF